MPLYLDFNTPEDIDRQYNLRLHSSDADTVIAGYAELSAAARTALRCETDVRFGPTLDETLDLFPAAAPDAPILLVIHGGYWRMLSARDFSFPALGFVAHGITVAASNYSLCPKVSIAEITRQNRAAAAFLREHGARWNGDPENLWVLGHSAGGHQALRVACTDWPGEYGLPADTIEGAISISGVYDLEPLRHSFLQPVLKLDEDLVARESPCRTIPSSAPPLRLYAAEREPEEFRRQMREFAAQWRAAGLTAEDTLCSGQDHFSIVNDLADPDSAFTLDVTRFITGE
jgi:arylformamidase